MKCKRIARCYMLGEERVEGEQLRSSDKVEGSRSQRGQVQRLTNMANGSGAVGVLVEGGAAGGEEQQDCAGQHRQRAARKHSPEINPPQAH